MPSYRIFSLKELCYVVAFLRLHFLRPTFQLLWLWLWKRHIPGMAVVCFTKSGFARVPSFFLFPGFLILGDVISQLLEILFRALTLPDLSYIYSTIGPSLSTRLAVFPISLIIQCICQAPFVPRSMFRIQKSTLPFFL